MRRVLACCLVVVAGAIGSPHRQLAAAPPNIVLLYADNLGYGDLGCYGNRQLQSPRIDQLARQGVRCTDFYVVTPSCTPSRGVLLTGRYPLRNGLAHQLVREENWHGIGLPHRERILPQYLQQTGYTSGCFGKWNIGFAQGSRPTERGFDEFFGCRSGNIHYFKHTYHGEYDIFRGIDRQRVEGYSTELFAEAACDFVRRHRERPFFLYLPFNAPHYVSQVNTVPGETPQWQVPAQYLKRYGATLQSATDQQRYQAVVTAMDDAVGEVLDTLDELKLADNTLVIFLSDMGAILQQGKGAGVASNGWLRDGAPTCYEGGVRVPAIFRWPGKLTPNSECRAMLSHLDLLPLCLTAAGAPLPADVTLDGANPLPALCGEQGSPHERLFFSYNRAAGLRDGNWKLVRSKPDQAWELYDLAKDLGESQNLAEQKPDVAARLDRNWQVWRSQFASEAKRP
jgi:arylsulfatase A-like enzyme